jgi:hypothetical protein
MKYKNDEYRAREARAQKGAANLLTLTGYWILGEPVLLHPALQEGLNVTAENLVILPSGGDYPYRLVEAVRETRSTALIIEPGATTAGSSTFYFTLLRCAGGTEHWHRALRLWVDIDRRPYLVPAPDGDEPEGQCFAIDKGVRPVDRPWKHEVDLEFGLRHADAVLQTP